MPPMLLDYDRLATVSKEIEPTKPIFMLNLIRFNDIAMYETTDSAFTSLPQVSGREAYYTRYITTLQSHMPPNSGPIFLGNTIASVLAQSQGQNVTEDGYFQGTDSQSLGEVEWDVAAVIKYDNFNDFKNMAESDLYKKDAMPHRIASIKEYKLIICEALEL